MIKYILFSALFFLVTLTSKSQTTDSAVIANADTTNFRPTTDSTWTLYNSYIGTTSDDSIDFEIIVQHPLAGIDWTQEQYVGLMKNQSFIPTSNKVIPFVIEGMQGNYILHIAVDGSCYLKSADGNLPSTDPLVLYVKVKY